MGWLDGQVAVVTGASSGIGEGLARMLAGNGATVALAARRDVELSSSPSTNSTRPPGICSCG
jgi:NADP-dependent 3-hydroxy acid dehydrogenase YdfG